MAAQSTAQLSPLDRELEAALRLARPSLVEVASLWPESLRRRLSVSIHVESSGAARVSARLRTDQRSAEAKRARAVRRSQTSPDNMPVFVELADGRTGTILWVARGAEKGPWLSADRRSA